MSYQRLNIGIGWLVFLIATIVYFLTLEETASLWDCGEYITAAYKLEVGHPPGAPFFMLVGRLFSLLALGDVADVALWINRMSALSSSFTILFLFWSITLLAKKIAQKDEETITKGQQIAIFGSAFVGAMAYAFTESFWFSAVEGEVYAMSSLFTAVIFWAALKWDEEMRLIQSGKLSNDTRPLRWMVLIMFLFGLAIGVHLLGLLVLPAIAYLVFYNLKEGQKITTKDFIITGIIGVFVLGFIQEGLIPGTIALASKTEIFFRNSLGLPFVTGVIFFFTALIALLIFAVIYTRKKNMVIANTVVLGIIMLFIGYGSFATIVIRSNANTPMDQNNPENLVTLHAYLKREQYGSWPILYGEYFNSKVAKQDEWQDRSPVFSKRHVVLTPKGAELAAFRDRAMAEQFVADQGKKLEIVHKYFETNQGLRENQVPVFLQNTIFPRMFYRGDANRTAGYKSWSGYNPNRKVDRSLIGEDGRPIPSFAENLTFFFNYQMDWMYWRYFMWNFSGRQNDIQGHGDEMRGNWSSGFSFIDEKRLGAQNENAPYFTSHNPSNNKFFFIPLVLGIIGLFFHALKAPRDAFVVFLVFVFTGIAIVVYLNQKPMEPRERDYAYAASFYAFAIWIGLGVYGLFETFRSYTKEHLSKLGIILGALLFLALVADFFRAGAHGTTFLYTLMIVLMIAGSSALLMLFKKINASAVSAASTALALGLLAPIILGVQGWDDHDRSNRTPARALAWNYLQSCSPNSILFTNGDNDTFPLWYLQSVEGVRTDVRVANLSLMQTDWYTEQMMMRAYDSDPLPIKFREDQILMGFGNTDIVLFIDYEVYSQQIDPAIAKNLLEAKITNNKMAFERSLRQFRAGLAGAIQMMEIKDKNLQDIIPQIVAELSQPIENPGVDEYNRLDRIVRKVFSDLNAKKLEADKALLQQLQDATLRWTSDWDYLPLEMAMEFVRDDKNMLTQQGGRKLRFFPSRGFIIPVNAENAAASGIIDEQFVDQCEDVIRFDFRKGRMFQDDVRGLSREEVMMLDILAHFDWKRGIYFSSPAGSDVSKAFYAEGRVQNVGQVYSLLPLKPQASMEQSKMKMYDHIMNVFDYGNLKAPGVLVDYYVRRHTGQFRGDFFDLAIMYAQDYRSAMNSARANELESMELDTTNNKSALIASNNKDAEFAADRVEEVIRKAMTELPMDRVLDFGEPRPTGRRLPNGKQVFTDGRITELISLLYQVEKIAYANEIAVEYLDQLETMLNFMEESNPYIVYKNENDFIAFCMNFMRMFREVYTANEQQGLGEKVLYMENRLSNVIVPKIEAALRNKEITETKNNVSTKRKMNKEADEFVALYEALLEENGLGGMTE